MICSLLDKGHRSEGWLAKRNIARNERENRGRYLSPPFLVRYPSLGPRSCQVIRVRIFCARLAIKYRLECLPSPPPIFAQPFIYLCVPFRRKEFIRNRVEIDRDLTKAPILFLFRSLNFDIVITLLHSLFLKTRSGNK